MAEATYFNRDLSWLLFNKRVMDEADNEQIPLYERIRFLSIFSSNLDEFFRVRMPVITAINRLNLHDKAKEESFNELTREVLETIHRQQEQFGHILRNKLIPGLKKYGIHFYYDQEIPARFREECNDFFRTRILSYIQIIDQQQDIELENNALYFLVSLKENEKQPAGFAILNIPTAHLPRFYSIKEDADSHIFFIDDVIRANLHYIFSKLEISDCFSIKITRNAEIEYNDISDEDIAGALEKQLDKRDHGLPTRFLHEKELPPALFKTIAKALNISKKEMVSGGRYHNLKDLAQLPNPGNPALEFEKWPPLRSSGQLQSESIFNSIQQSDRLIHFPYQSYDTIIRFFNEAAIDQDVVEIYITLYRIAADSRIANALISAAKNGKSVFVFVELKARFDEANNIKWAKKMKAAGVKIIYSRYDLKVHAKIALVHKKSGLKHSFYSILATGNFNENTALFYSDHALLTADPQITRELNLLFAFLQTKKKPEEYPSLVFNHILVSQFNLQSHFAQLIRREIRHAESGKQGSIMIKLNNLEDQGMIDELYNASRAGVHIQLIVRGICCLVPGVPGQSEHIRVIRIVDRYLEHSRLFWFNNDGDDEIYAGSADWMSRNLYKRIEVSFGIRNAELKEQLKHILRIQLADNQQAVQLLQNYETEKVAGGAKPVRSQQATREYLMTL